MTRYEKIIKEILSNSENVTKYVNKERQKITYTDYLKFYGHHIKVFLTIKWINDKFIKVIIIYQGKPPYHKDEKAPLCNSYKTKLCIIDDGNGWFISHMESRPYIVHVGVYDHTFSSYIDGPNDNFVISSIDYFASNLGLTEFGAKMLYAVYCL